MSGQLEEHPLAELIREIKAAGLSGALRLASQRIKEVVYFDAGEVVYATSNLRSLRLSECLRRWGVIEAQQLANLPTTTTDSEFGALLVSQGLLDSHALEEVLVHQVSDVIRPALLWTEGEWEFDARVRLAENMRVRMLTQKLLIEAARRLPAAFIASRFKNESERISPASSDWTGVEVLPTEAFVLSRVDAPISVHELISISGHSEDETLRAVYVLALGGFLKRDDWPTALTTEAMLRGRAKPAPTQKAATVSAQAPPPVTEEKSAAPPKVPAKTDENDRIELDQLFARLERADDYYQVMGISHQSSLEDVKRAYRTLARRFHPDKFHHDADKALHARVESAFARIAQAHEMLKDTQARARYDVQIQAQRLMRRNAERNTTHSRDETSAQSNNTQTQTTGGEGPTGSPAFNAEENFQKGSAALRQGNGKAALSHFAEAVRLAPKEARYRAHYGQALARNEPTRRMAETELQAAVALDANNAAYRVMLAELYLDIGLQRRAQGELQRALTIDPHSAAARRLQERMEKQG